MVACVSIVAACLPELGPLPTAVAPELEAGAAIGCGDGIIATNDDGSDAGEACDPGGDPAAGCSPACTISCGGIIGPSGHCYFVADPSDYANAVTNCSNAFAHVVTIGSEDEAKLVRTLAGEASYRVGLLLDDTLTLVAYKPASLVEEPGWPTASSCAGCFAQGPTDTGAFAPLDPDAGVGHRCLIAASDDKWLQIPCNRRDSNILTICEREPLGQRAQACGGPLCSTLPSTAGRKRYVISLATATAPQADQFCRGYPGGSLVVLESRE